MVKEAEGLLLKSIMSKPSSRMGGKSDDAARKCKTSTSKLSSVSMNTSDEDMIIRLVSMINLNAQQIIAAAKVEEPRAAVAAAAGPAEAGNGAEVQENRIDPHKKKEMKIDGENDSDTCSSTSSKSTSDEKGWLREEEDSDNSENDGTSVAKKGGCRQKEEGEEEVDEDGNPIPKKKPEPKVVKKDKSGRISSDRDCMLEIKRNQSVL